ncbi:LOW QUALITY PROTEIN: induced myeloid leukemia cell differentiation protein Mcl-1 homolog [Manacus candei]|uniref:LOW QUALITY PROTEIN: induced myeloid leukemia cell differentiation protein Mcl-1 homolog n=1 Tax=Manacus candei TaxID=415023 RepID=UPI0022279154|nr:LOW QUALITY PROTEIN: induced myeloid leukemia cell differentiation protein Mcl-1 homolog [Manacus candei]
MFSLKPRAVLGFNLYCGGSPALAPAAPPPRPEPSAGAASGAASGAAAPAGAASGAAASAERAPLAAAGRPPRTLIGCAAAPRALIGCGAALWRPEQELDGCDPDAEKGPPEEEEGGDSLPGTPPGPPDPLRQDTLELIGRYLREAAGEASPAGGKKLFPGLLGGPGRPGAAGEAVMEKALETLRRVGDGVMRKHELAFQGMLRKLELRQEQDLQAVVEVANHVFSDGVTNWGRVVTLVAFGAFVARQLRGPQRDRGMSSLARILTDALVSSRREWLLSQGGWEGFVDFFRVEDLEGSIRNVLVAFAGVAGLGAGLAYMIR